MPDKIKIGHIGCGYWGRNIIKTLNDMGCLYGVSDNNLNHIEDIKKEFSDNINSFETNEMISSSEVKGITLATPAETHFEIGMQVLESGKNLYVEKPLTLDIEEAKTMVDFAIKNKLILQVGHLMIYHPAFKLIKKMINEKFFGDILSISSNRLKWGKVRSFENVAWSFAPHDISMISYLLDSNLRLESCYLKKLTPGTEDTAHIFLSSDNGTNCHIYCSWLNPFKEFRFCIVGNKNSAVYLDGNDFIDIFKTDMSSEDNNWAPPHSKKMKIDKTVKPLREALSDFTESCWTSKQPLASGLNGLEVVDILQSVNKKLYEN
tara:strand:+ start:768 stop:1727 length:960 start_codon:yes stop_codon:yes gene_type:complete